MVEKKYNEVTLKDGRIFKFHKDISMKKMNECGVEPNRDAPSKEVMSYNQTKIVAFAFDPILTESQLEDLDSFDYMQIFKSVIMDYNTKMQNFLLPPKK